MTKETRLRALEYQIDRLQKCVARRQRTSYRYSWLRFAVVLGGLVAVGPAFYSGLVWLGGLCLAATVLLFGLAVYYHRQVEDSIARHQVWHQLKTAHLARATLDWQRIPTAFYHRLRPDHPFESDLDLVGRRSLHRLLDTAISFEGSQRLRDWLTVPVPDAEQIAHRQQLVRELAPLHLFRDRLTMNATIAVGAKRTWRASQLVTWLEAHTPQTSLRRWLILFTVMAGLNAILFVAHWGGWLSPWWRITIVLYIGLWLVRAGVTDVLWDEAGELQGVLRQLRAVFFQLEAFSYRDTPHLKALCAPFLDPAHRPSRYMARLTRVMAAMGLRGNPIVRFVLNAVVPWDFYFAYRLTQYKADLAHHAPTWMDTWFELEALGALANLAYLNPSYTFPRMLDREDDEVQDQERCFVFQAQGLGHPLIPDDEKICNDFALPTLGQVTIITGSNMAGKSVFLKTVGVNLVLAYAGGPVDARRLETMLFRPFTCMGISDSVTSGISYFYAEVKRLKTLLAALEGDHPLPLLFCIDEIFRGTNNRERLIGSRAYVRVLAGKHGTGFIATHDLELARLADEVPQVVNYHFRDHVAGDRMAFDYTLRPGPCPTTNALKIMQLEGLPVPLAAATMPTDYRSSGS